MHFFRNIFYISCPNRMDMGHFGRFSYLLPLFLTSSARGKAHALSLRQRFHPMPGDCKASLPLHLPCSYKAFLYRKQGLPLCPHPSPRLGLV